MLTYLFHILQVLARLSTNLLISCVANDSPVPKELNIVREYAGKDLDAKDPKWQLVDLMVQYANLRSDICGSSVSTIESVSRAIELDIKLQTLSLTMPLSWKYNTAVLNSNNTRVYEDLFDSYLNRHVTQTWNVLRLVRILLNEFILENGPIPERDDSHQAPTSSSIQTRTNSTSIQSLSSKICASVPQYTNCSNLGCHEFTSFGDTPAGCLHTPAHSLDRYTLIFPLYVAGRSKYSSQRLRTYVINELQYMNSHFGIRNAGLVAQILEQGKDVNPWAIYAMLGSYAFVA